MTRRIGAVVLIALAMLPLLPAAHGGANGFALALASQAASLVVFALSYDLLLGQTGLLSLGHATYYGIGALAAARVANAYALPAPWLPLAGGIGAALVALPLGWLCARRGGMTFAMITLGLGEMVAAAALTMPDIFGGVGGVMIDRAAGGAWLGIDFGGQRAAYALVAAWALLSVALIAHLLRTPLARIANAVRDNPRRAAFVGFDPRRVRWVAVVVAAFFAGIAGALSVITFEIASADNVGLATSASALIATVIGGSGTLAGPIVGAVVHVLMANGLSSVTHAWPMYVGVFFMLTVVFAPDGLAGLGARGMRALRAMLARRGALTQVGVPLAAVTLAASGVLAGSVIAIESVYAWRFAEPAEQGGATIASGAVLAMLSILMLRAAAGRLRRLSPVQRDASASAAVGTASGDDYAIRQANRAGAPVIATVGHDRAPAAATLTLSGIHLRFGATEVLRGVDLDVASGECHALIGPNGAGKSTLFNVVSGAVRPDRGTVRLGGVAIDRLPAHRIARLGLSRSFQTPNLFARLSVLDNLRCALLWPLGVRHGGWRGLDAMPQLRERALAWLATVGIGHEADKPAGALGYAQQRALELAMTAASGADVLLLDEPTAGMSRAEARDAIELIRVLARGRTVLLIEHDMDAVFDLADRISVLVDGVVVATGTPAQIRDDPRVRAAYLGDAR